MTHFSGDSQKPFQHLSAMALTRGLDPLHTEAVLIQSLHLFNTRSIKIKNGYIIIHNDTNDQLNVPIFGPQMVFIHIDVDFYDLVFLY